jgi:hypothetical protein
MLTLALVLLSGRPSSLGAATPARPPNIAALETPAVSISISLDPSALLPHAEPALPVVLPGYLLPADDRVEEPVHAGG